MNSFLGQRYTRIYMPASWSNVTEKKFSSETCRVHECTSEDNEMKKLMILALMLIAVNVQAENDSHNNDEETGTYSGQLGDNQYTTASTNNSNGQNDDIYRSNPNNPYEHHGSRYSNR